MGEVRQTKTKHKLHEAFYQLLAKSGYQQMNIKELCQAAGINRGTFYNNYDSKAALWQEIENVHIQNVEAILSKSQVADEFYAEEIKNVMDYLYSQQREFYIIAQSDLFVSFQQELVRLIRAVFQRHHYGMKELIQSRKYEEEIVYGGIASIISLWIKDNFQESPQEMMQIILAYRDHAPKEYFYLQLKNKPSLK